MSLAFRYIALALLAILLCAISHSAAQQHHLGALQARSPHTTASSSTTTTSSSSGSASQSSSSTTISQSTSGEWDEVEWTELRMCSHLDLLSLYSLLSLPLFSLPSSKYFGQRNYNEFQYDYAIHVRYCFLRIHRPHCWNSTSAIS
jgi:hypothetical protein